MSRIKNYLTGHKISGIICNIFVAQLRVAQLVDCVYIGIMRKREDG